MVGEHSSENQKQLGIVRTKKTRTAWRVAELGLLASFAPLFANCPKQLDGGSE
jgi:hypothetical protein